MTTFTTRKPEKEEGYIISTPYHYPAISRLVSKNDAWYYFWMQQPIEILERYSYKEFISEAKEQGYYLSKATFEPKVIIINE